jgi:hypothetical protein
MQPQGKAYVSAGCAVACLYGLDRGDRYRNLRNRNHLHFGGKLSVLECGSCIDILPVAPAYSVHLGLHWSQIMAAFRKMFGIRHPSRIRTWALRLAAIAMAVAV